MCFSLDLNTKNNDSKINKIEEDFKKTNKPFKVSFLILAHKNPSQIVTFINTLNCKDVSFFIHINKESDIANHSSLEKLRSRKNVSFIEQRQKITWGGYGIISATLLLLKECLEKDENDYISLHSGQDLPIINKYEIIDFLKRNQGKEFIEFFNMPNIGWWPDNGFDRIQYYWFIEEFGLEKSWKLYDEQIKLNVKREYFEDLQPYGGSTWWTITRECAQFIIDYTNQNKNYCDYYKYTLLPDEGFIQTIILNSHFKDRVINNNFRFIDWLTGPQSPKIFTADDFDRIIASNKLFARKFDINIDNTIIKMIKNRIL